MLLGLYLTPHSTVYLENIWIHGMYVYMYVTITTFRRLLQIYTRQDAGSCLKPVTFCHIRVLLCVRTVTVIMLLWIMFCTFHFVSPFSDCVSYWLCIDSGENELLWKKNCPSVTLSVINLIRTRQGSNDFFQTSISEIQKCSQESRNKEIKNDIA